MEDLRLSGRLTRRTGVALLLLALASPAFSASSRGGESRFLGRVASVDLALGQFGVTSNLTATGFTFTFTVDGNTDFNGEASSLAELQIDYDVDIRYVFAGTERLVVRLDSSLPAVPRAGALVIDLDVPPGKENVPVLRVVGDDAGENLGGYKGDGMTFGDVNGDGFDDLIVRGGRPGVAFSDAVVVVYGDTGVAGLSIDLDTDGAVSVHGETRILPSVQFQSLGAAVGIGDLDADGFDDMILGQDGGAHVIFGDDSLPGTTITLDPALSAPSEFRFLTGELPVALAAGDLNADGYDDLIADAGGLGVFVVYGGAGMRGATVDVRSVTQSAPGVTRILIPGLGNFGPTVRSLATGDVNGDGFDDLVLGAQRGISPTLISAAVVYGSQALSGTLVDLNLAIPTGPPHVTLVTGRGMDAVACGDFDGDGFDEVMLASPNITGPGDNFIVGEVNVLYGSASLPGSTLSVIDPAGVNPNETRITGREEFGEFGTDIAAADIDGDGLHDLVMAATGSVPFGTLPETNARSDGAVYAFVGRPGLAGQHLIDPREVSDVYVFADDEDDRLGSVVAAGGDMDRDGLPEYAASATSGTNPSLGPNSFSGYAAILFNHGLPLPATATVRRASRAGDGLGDQAVPPADFGPVVRVVVDFSDGDQSTAGTTTATLMRGGMPGTAGVTWAIDTTRSGWNRAKVTLRYTDAEVAGLIEGKLGVLRADSLAGPFRFVPSTLNRLRNQITARVNRLGVFILAEKPRYTQPGNPPRPRRR